jgi:glycosyltransferase involved in cell wall biosynthesis
MRVLHVSEVAIGGVATLIRAFSTEQLRRGDEPLLLCPEPLGLPVDAYLPWQLHRKEPWNYARAYSQLATAVRRTRPDIVHLHSFFAGLIGRLPPGVALREVGVIYQPHAWNFAAARGSGSLRAVSGWERWASRRTDVVAVNCEDEAQEGRAYGIRPDPVVVGFPVDPAAFLPADAATRARSRLELGLDSRRVVLCLGALCWQKGQDRLVAAWERRPPPDAVLVLAGGSGGPYLRRQDPDVLRRSAPHEWERSIVPVGHQVDVRPWLQAADVVIQPSRYESMSVAIAEALCSGVPVVTFDVVGAREAIMIGSEQDVAGDVVPQGDVEALLAALVRRLEDPALLESERAAARRRGLRLFAPDGVVPRLEEAYALALSRARLRRR